MPRALRRVAAPGALLAFALLPSCRDLRDSEPAPRPQIRLASPVVGVPGRDWVINNYVDLEPGPDIRDYRGGTRSYDRHRGTDFDVPNFRWMDRGVPVVAAADGRVTAVHDGEFDRNVSCGFLEILRQPNLVELTHADGTRSLYLHLRRGSVTVALGQEVTAGEPLGEVGSSGCSTAPHLHFEVLDPAGNVVDPFRDGLWTAPPPYALPLTVMDLVIKSGAIAGEDELKDPPPNATDLAPDVTLGIGLVIAGGSPGDRIEVRLDGAAGAPRRAVRGQEPPHSFWFWNVPPDEHRGARRIAVYGNDALLADHEIGPPAPG